MPTTVVPGSIIKIKRSSGITTPSLAVGELAYSWGGPGTYNDGGEKLFIGVVAGNGIDIITTVIGGKYFTDMLDHVPGKITASSALIVDSNKKIDQLKTTNITIGGDGETVPTVVNPTPNDITANGLLRLNPSNNYVYIGSMYSLPTTAPSVLGYVLTADTNGTTTWSAPSTSLYVGTDGGDKLQVDILSETFEIFGDSNSGVVTTGYAGSVGPGGAYVGSQGNTLKISVRDATTSLKGVAKYNGDDFVLDSGTVSIGGSVVKFFTSNDGAYIGSNGAKTSNGEIKIKGNSTSGIQTTIIEGDTVSVVGTIPSDTQRGTASFSLSHFYVGSAGSNDPADRGRVFSQTATKNSVGVASFPEANFGITAQGAVSINQATVSGINQKLGVAIFDKDNFTVASNSGIVTAKPIYLGTTELILGEGIDPSDGSPIAGGANNSVTGLSDVEVGKLYLSGVEIAAVGNDNIESPSYDANLDINLMPKGTGNVKIWDSWYLPGETSNANAITDYVLTYNSDNTTSWKASAAKLYIRDALNPGRDNGDFYVDLLSKQLEFSGDSLKGITASTVGYTSSYPGVKISATYSGYSGSTAGDSHVGVSSFFSDTFVINNYGGVNVKDGGISNSQLVNSSLTVGSTSISLGGTVDVVSGLRALNFESGLSIVGYQGSNTITTTNGSLYLQPALGEYVKIGSTQWNLPDSKGNDGEVLTTDGVSGATWQGVPRLQYILTDGTSLLNGYVGSLKLGVDTLKIIGENGIYTDMVNTPDGSISPTIHIGVDTASYDHKGVSKYSSNDFVVTSGAVELIGTVLESVSANNGSAIPYGHDLKVLGYVGSGTFSGAIQTIGYGGSSGINPSGGKMDIVARLASDTLTGVASFNASHFYTGSNPAASIVNGAITAKPFYIGSSSFNLGTSTMSLSGLDNLTVNNIQISGNTISTIDPSAASVDIILDPKGTGEQSGVVNVSGARITNVANPQSDNDAVNKLYADAMISGLDVKNSVRAATNIPLYGTYTPDFGYLGSTGNWGRFSSNINEALVVDSVELITGDRVLLKDQGIIFVDGDKVAGIAHVYIPATSIVGNEFPITSTISVTKGTKFKIPSSTTGLSGVTPGNTYYIAEDVTAGKKFTLAATYADAIAGTALTITGTPSASTEDTATQAELGDADGAKANGIYVVTDAGSAISNWVLTRANDSNIGVLPGGLNSTYGQNVTTGMFTFVEEGNIWLSSGFILVTINPVIVGTTPLTFTQFSSAGRILAGDGLDKIGDNISIVASETSGIKVNADSIEINPTIAGDALSFTSGILNVGFDNSTVGYTGSIDKKLRIHESYPGQISITTVGTITGGTWHGTTIDIGYGGTGRTSLPKGSILYSEGYLGSMAILTAGADYQFLMIDGTTSLPVWSDIDGGTY